MKYRKVILRRWQDTHLTKYTYLGRHMFYCLGGNVQLRVDHLMVTWQKPKLTLRENWKKIGRQIMVHSGSVNIEAP